MTKLKERQERHAKHKLARMKPINESGIKKVFRTTPKREGKVWVIRTINKRTGRSVEIRNPDKQEALNDLATISGYQVERKSNVTGETA